MRRPEYLRYFLIGLLGAPMPIASRRILCLLALASSLVGLYTWFSADACPAELAQGPPEGVPAIPIGAPLLVANRDGDREEARRMSGDVDQTSCIITGLVRQLNARPLAGVNVSLWNEVDGGRQSPQSSVTGADGTFSFSVQWNNVYRIEACSAEFGTVIAGPILGPQHALLQFDAPSSIDLRVAAETPVLQDHRVVVRLWRSEADSPTFTRSITQPARILMEPIQPGSWVLSIEPAGGEAPPWRKLQLQPGERRNVEIVFGSGPLFTIRAVDSATGAPLSSVEVTRGVRGAFTSYTDSSGLVAIQGFPGHSLSTIRCSKPGYVDRVITGHSAVTRPPDAGPYVINMEPNRVVSGVACDLSGTGLALCSVYCAWGEMGNDATTPYKRQVTPALLDANAQFATVKADQDGRFVVPGIPATARAVLLSAQAPGYCRSSMVVQFPPDDAEEPPVVLTCQPAGRLEVQVLDSSGRPAIGAEVLATKSDELAFDERRLALLYDQTVMKATTDATGLAILSQLHSGPCTVESLAGGVRVDSRAAVNGQDRRRITIHLPFALTHSYVHVIAAEPYVRMTLVEEGSQYPLACRIPTNEPVPVLCAAGLQYRVAASSLVSVGRSQVHSFVGGAAVELTIK